MAEDDPFRPRFAYPLGSGQAEELALAAGLKPMLRQLLTADDLPRAKERFTRAGWLTLEGPSFWLLPGGEHATDHFDPRGSARTPLFVGRDPARLEEAIAREAEHHAGDLELGRLLGFPRCCVEAFVAVSVPRENLSLWRAARGKTRRAHPLLNVLDLSVFHYISWIPCSFDCALSVRYAEALEARVASRHPQFVADVRAALGAHRLVLDPDAQLSFRAPDARDAWPTARDRHPGARLDAAPRARVEQALRAVRELGASAVRAERFEFGPA